MARLDGHLLGCAVLACSLGAVLESTAQTSPPRAPPTVGVPAPSPTTPPAPSPAAPAPTSAPAAAPPPTAPTTAPPSAPSTAPQGAPTTTPPKLPDYYYADDPSREPSREPTTQGRTPRELRPPPPFIFEPPPPPPPPVPRHTAPSDSLWVGVRGGLFSPFGLLWAKASMSRSGLTFLEGIPWQDYASLGPFFELDAGARLGRNYNAFVLWEHAFLPVGGLGPDSRIEQTLGSTDFWAAGLRINSNPDRVGFVAEVAVGYRRFVANWEDGSDLTLSDSILETRVGVGAEIRLGPMASLTPLLTLAAGTFADARWDPDRPAGVFADDVGRIDEQASHGSLTLQIGGHLDLFGAN